MNRFVRNGIAVAGMAGGIFFLGQAAASADTDANQTVTPSAESGNLSLGSGGGAAAGNDTTAVNIAAQVTATSVSTNADTGGSISVSQNSGDNNVPGNSPNSTYSTESRSMSPGGAVQNVDANTGNSADIAVSTGDINKSGNISGDAVKAATGGGGGDVTANQTVTPSATAGNLSLDLGGFPSLPGTEFLSAPNGSSGGASAGNSTTAINAAIDLALTNVSTNADTGPEIDVDQTSGDNNITCYAVVCNIHANTGNTANITVQTGDINDSANIGGHHDAYKHGYHDGYKHGHHDGYHKAVAPEHKKPAVAPVKRSVAPAATVTRSAAQPKGQLASTGAETTAPLALGLIALGAGGALTLAGRRRGTTAAA